MARYLIETSSTDGYQLETTTDVLLIETPTGLVHGPGPGSVHGPAGGGRVHGSTAPIIADTKISALPASIGTAFGQEVMFAINESGTTKKLTGNKWQRWAGNTIRNQSVAVQTPAVTESTYITNSNLLVPSEGLAAGVWLRWTLIYNKTAAGTATRSIVLRCGTAGSISDAALATYTSGTPTGAADVGRHQFTLILRTTGASATTNIAERFSHHLSTTGLTNTNEVICTQGAGATFNSATANLIFGLSITVGTGETLNIQQCLAEAYNL
jgi:hypothetical protein